MDPMGLEIKDYCGGGGGEKIGDFFAGDFLGDFCFKEGKVKMEFCKKHVEWRKRSHGEETFFFLNEIYSLLTRCGIFSLVGSKGL